MYIISNLVTLPGTNISPPKDTFEDYFPFPKVGYVIIPWRVFIPKDLLVYLEVGSWKTWFSKLTFNLLGITYDMKNKV